MGCRLSVGLVHRSLTTACHPGCAHETALHHCDHRHRAGHAGRGRRRHPCAGRRERAQADRERATRSGRGHREHPRHQPERHRRGDHTSGPTRTLQPRAQCPEPRGLELGGAAAGQSDRTRGERSAPRPAHGGAAAARAAAQRRDHQRFGRQQGVGRVPVERLTRRARRRRADPFGRSGARSGRGLVPVGFARGHPHRRLRRVPAGEAVDQAACGARPTPRRGSPRAT